jgi:eukaryotic-like serine/threonine-protein kinase
MEERSGPARVFELGQVIRDEVESVTYRTTRFIGRGGMGEVYEVVRDDTGEHFAMKCLQAHLAKNPKVLQRAWNEASALRDLRHPNVVRVRAAGVRDDGLIWMMMDLLVGHTLLQLLGELNKVPIPWALRIMRDAALGLTAVHAFAVHRDLKPENIHLGRDGQVRLLDLGAGKFHKLGVTTSGPRTLGTVPYMSPEQLRTPETIDARSDLFSAGVVLFELLSGKHPFAPGGLDQENVYRLVASILGVPHTPLASAAPWVPPAVAAVVERCLHKDPDLRCRDAAELAAALDAALAEAERATGPAPPLTTLTEALHRLGAVAGPRDPLRTHARTVMGGVTGEESTFLRTNEGGVEGYGGEGRERSSHETEVEADTVDQGRGVGS